MKPWEPRKCETAKAYEAFCEYLELGLDRSVDTAWRLHFPDSKAKRASSVWRQWCTDHDWPERARAYDAHELLGWIDDRVEVRERARQHFFTTVHDVVMKLIKIALGEIRAKPQQVHAIKEVLSQCGMAPIDPTNEGHDDGTRPLTLDELSQIFNEEEVEAFEELCSRASERREAEGLESEGDPQK